MQNVASTKALPLEAAYPFGVEHGLGKEIEEIKNMEIEWDRSITSSLRRGYILRLFQTKGVFEEFWQKHWPNYQTREGRRLARWYLKNAEEYDGFLGGKEVISEDGNEEERTEFAYESDLRDFLAKHLELVETGLSLTGVEYGVEGGELTFSPRIPTAISL